MSAFRRFLLQSGMSAAGPILAERGSTVRFFSSAQSAGDIVRFEKHARDNRDFLIVSDPVATPLQPRKPELG